jgi:site-specific recombinase XerD
MGVFKKGNNWYIDYYLKGRRKRKKVGHSKKLAEQILKDIQVKIVKGEYLGVLEEKKAIFEEFARLYMDYSKTNKSPSTFQREQAIFRGLVAYFGGKYLFEINSQMIEEYKTMRLQKGVVSATINREMSCLKHLFSKAVEWRCINRNPSQGVKQMKEPPGRIRYLEVGEIECLMRAIEVLPQGTGRYLRPIVIVALNTGLRKSEILQLRWRDLVFHEKRITVLKTKNNELRVIPMNETVFQELCRIDRHPKSEYVFCNRKGEPYNNVRKSFERTLKIAGINDFRFHDLRHTFASHLVMSGCNIRTVQQLMGHKDIKMTMRYSHLSKEHLQEAVGKLDMLWTPYGHQVVNRSEKADAGSVLKLSNSKSLKNF